MKKDQLQTPQRKKNRSVQTYTIHHFLPHLEVKQTNERLETTASENSRNGMEIKKGFDDDKEENNRKDFESDDDEDSDCLSNQSTVSVSFAILNTMFLQINFVFDLPKKTNNNPHN